MAEISPAAWGENAANHARQARLLATGPLTDGIWGWVTATASPLRVSGVGTGSAVIAAGGTFVSAGAGQGSYACYNDANVSIAIPPQGAGSARTDLIVARVYDTFLGDGGADRWVLERVDGTTGAPAVPTAPARSYVLARVTVNAGASVISSITDMRYTFGELSPLAITKATGATEDAWVYYDTNGTTKIARIAVDGTFYSGTTALLNLSMITTKGDLIVGTAAGTASRLAVGSNTQVLIADSTQATGVRWGANVGAAKTYRIPHTFTIAGPVAVASGDVNFILPFYISLPAGQTATVAAARHSLNSGTSATWTLSRGGTNITGLTTISSSTTPTTHTASGANTLADGEAVKLVITAVSGSPQNLSVTVFIDYTV